MLLYEHTALSTVGVLTLEESLRAAVIQIVGRVFPRDYPRGLRSDLQRRRTQTYYQFLWGLIQFALR